MQFGDVDHILTRKHEVQRSLYPQGEIRHKQKMNHIFDPQAVHISKAPEHSQQESMSKAIR